jgi:hypothetical protein
MSSAKQVFSLLQGVWRFTRSVVNKAPLQEYDGTGYAVFSLLSGSANELKYHERVILKNLYTKQTVKGYQTYRYLYNSDLDEIIKYLENGKLFYKLNISGLDCLGYHLCVKDDHKATYHFNNDNKFSLQYKVIGPKNNYSISTEYTRITGQDLPALGVIYNGEIGELS